MKKSIIFLAALALIASMALTGCEFPSKGESSGDKVTSGEYVSPYANSKDIFAKYYEKADKLMKNMSTKEKVGQLFLARYPSKYEDANKEIESLYPAGYILFADNVKVETQTSLKDKIDANQKRAKTPMFIAVDEEGGTVVRISSSPVFKEKPYSSPMDIYTKDGMEGVVENATEKSQFLKGLGINMNLAPVVDVPTSKKSFIYKRSFGTDKELTAEFAKEVIEAMNDEKIISCMKHFPGYGDNADTHKDVATDKRKEEAFYSGDFLPFVAGIKEDAPAIMVCHNIVQAFDKDNPASLSREVHDVLRNDLDFSGLIITDDLAMAAVNKYVKSNSAAKTALLAGNDLIITSSLSTHVDEILNAITNKELDIELVNNAVRRILAAKMYYGIIESK
jgi:beta-N-acetylhexosaminidase